MGAYRSAHLAERSSGRDEEVVAQPVGDHMSSRSSLRVSTAQTADAADENRPKTSEFVVDWSCAPGPSRLSRPERHSPQRAPSPALPSSDGSALLITSCWPVRLLGLTAP